MINKASQLCFLQRANIGQTLFYDILCLRFDTAVTDGYMISWNVLMWVYGKVGVHINTK